MIKSEGFLGRLLVPLLNMNWGFFSMVLGTLGASLLGNILPGKEINRAGEGAVRAGYGNKRQDHEKKMGF